jgi:hypothetical protein
LEWCNSYPGKDSSPYPVVHGIPPAQSSKKSAPLGVSGHNGILTSVYYEGPNISCAAFAEFEDFHSKPASLWWYVLNPTQSSFPEEERLIDTDVLFQCVYRAKLGIQVIKDRLDFIEKYFPTMYNFTVAILNGSYMFQLQSSRHQVLYVRSIKGNHIPVIYI